MARTSTVHSFAALNKGAPLQKWQYELREPRAADVVIDIAFCGICHTDLHMINDWGRIFPLVPGHEMVGRVVEVGSEVVDFTIGDVVGVGTIRDSCRRCEPCRRGLETYCVEGATPTYGGLDRQDGTPTYGGYSDRVVLDERFVFAMPPGLDLAGAAPLFCAGITTFAPLRHWGVGPGSIVAVQGIGGLGHLALKFAKAMGAEVVALTSSAHKADTARRLGADDIVVLRDDGAAERNARRFDLILDTAAAAHPLDGLLELLRLDGTLVSLGLPPATEVTPMTLAVGRRSLAGSGAGGTVEIADMLDFCLEHDIVADIETLRTDQINVGLDRLRRNDVKFRFVIDMNQE